MSIDSAYAEIAERALVAADGAQACSMHENATFLGYHAFESIGGAYCTNRGNAYPLGHQAKIREFVTRAASERFALQAANLATAYRSLRNAVLYPAAMNGLVTRPKDVLSPSQAQRLIGRTKSLAKYVKKVL